MGPGPGDDVTAVLLAEGSANRRLALTTLLERRGCGVLAPDGMAGCLDLLRAAGTRIDAVVLGLTDAADTHTEELLALLHREGRDDLPVLLLSDANDALQRWRSARPRRALMLCSDYSECDEALDRMLRPPPRAANDAVEVDTSALRILLIDDSATVRAAFVRLLRQHGYQVDTASNVEEGFAKATAQPLDIAIVDYFMPGQNGTALIAALRRDPRTQHVLSAMITGTYADEVIVESLASGAVECLFKSEAKGLFLARLASLARTVRDRKAIDAERRRLEGILAAVGDGVFGVDVNGIIQFVNPAALELLGYPDAAALIGRDAAEAVHPGQIAQSRASPELSFLSQCYLHGNQVPHWQSVFWTSAREPIPVEGTVYPLRVDGERRGSVVAFRDVSAQRKLEEQLRWQAEHDSLTKLPNRGWFEAQLEIEIQRLRSLQTESVSALLFIDLDRFKYINDTAGHSAGDQLLIEVSRRLRSRMRASDHLARMGGDEYAIVLRDVPREQIESLAESIRTALTDVPFVHAGKTYRITISIGVTALDRRTASLTEAMAQADVACHQSKNDGRNRCHVYTHESGSLATMEADLGWSARLEKALRHDRFELMFQPIVPLRGLENESLDATPANLWRRQFARNPSEPLLFEVLVRLRNGRGELILPNAFLPSAERFGMMEEIDRWVIDHAMKALREVRHHHRPFALTMNLSSQSLASDSLVDFIAERIVRYEVDPGALIFEVTESRTIEDIVGTRALLRRLRLLGCRIAIDDFGTGFSTFAYLRQLDADYLKIDGSIIQGLPHDTLDRSVVAALTSIAESTGKRTIAEWAESSETLAALYECGVDYAQGFVLGIPRLDLLEPLEYVTGVQPAVGVDATASRSPGIIAR